MNENDLKSALETAVVDCRTDAQKLWRYASERTSGPVAPARGWIVPAVAASLSMVIVALFLVVAASKSSVTPVDTPAAADGIVTYKPAEMRPAGELLGSLSLKGDCLLFEGAPAIFPPGTVFREETVILADGTRLALGAQLSRGGGYISGLITALNLLPDAEKATLQSCSALTNVDEVALLY